MQKKRGLNYSCGEFQQLNNVVQWIAVDNTRSIRFARKRMCIMYSRALTCYHSKKKREKISRTCEMTVYSFTRAENESAVLI